MIKCGLCGKEFQDDQFDEYAIHVQKCAYDRKIKADTEKMKKINEELEKVKRAGQEYERLKKEFKEKYPDVYKANFESAASYAPKKPENTENTEKVSKEEEIKEKETKQNNKKHDSTVQLTDEEKDDFALELLKFLLSPTGYYEM